MSHHGQDHELHHLAQRVACLEGDVQRMEALLRAQSHLLLRLIHALEQRPRHYPQVVGLTFTTP